MTEFVYYVYVLQQTHNVLGTPVTVTDNLTRRTFHGQSPDPCVPSMPAQVGEEVSACEMTLLRVIEMVRDPSM